MIWQDKRGTLWKLFDTSVKPAVIEWNMNSIGVLKDKESLWSGIDNGPKDRRFRSGLDKVLSLT